MIRLVIIIAFVFSLYGTSANAKCLIGPVSAPTRETCGSCAGLWLKRGLKCMALRKSKKDKMKRRLIGGFLINMSGMKTGVGLSVLPVVEAVAIVTMKMIATVTTKINLWTFYIIHMITTDNITREHHFVMKVHLAIVSE